MNKHHLIKELKDVLENLPLQCKGDKCIRGTMYPITKLKIIIDSLQDKRERP